MPDFNSDITANAALAMPAQLRPFQSGGRVRSMLARITWAAAPQIADRLLCFTLRAGWTPMPGGLIVPSVGLGAAATLALGVAGTVAKYGTARIYNTAGAQVFNDVPGPIGVPLAADEAWFLTVAAAALPAAGTVLVFQPYVMD